MASVGKQAGINPVRSYCFLKSIPKYIAEYKKIVEQSKKSKFKFDFSTPYPVLNESTQQSGSVFSHYFLQDLYVAQRIHQLNPNHHIDVGSRIDGFIAHLATFRDVEVFDIRPMDAHVSGIKFTQADLMELPDNLVGATDSLSCLHTIEHFGLGRYGDPIDYDGFDKGLQNMTKILRAGGRFHFSVPIGPQRIEFNAHRVFSMTFLTTYLSDMFHIHKFSYIGSKPCVIEDVDPYADTAKTNFGCSYGCGIFELIKK